MITLVINEHQNKNNRDIRKTFRPSARPLHRYLHRVRILKWLLNHSGLRNTLGARLPLLSRRLDSQSKTIPGKVSCSSCSWPTSMWAPRAPRLDPRPSELSPHTYHLLAPQKLQFWVYKWRLLCYWPAMRPWTNRQRPRASVYWENDSSYFIKLQEGIDSYKQSTWNNIYRQGHSLCDSIRY